MTALTQSSQLPPDLASPRYALLVDSLDDEHELSVVQGTLKAARELDARLLVIPGGPVDSADPRRRVHNFAFDLLAPGRALGVLVLSSALGNEIGPERLRAWLERFRGVPLCCAGVAIEGHVSARVDNATGIREVVRHLLEVHGKRNLGFIRGPEHSDEAEVRLAAYREELAAHGVTPDPRWIAEGDYERPSGALAVRTILDQRRVPAAALDALVCANDYMALGALDELGRRGINVPEQLALTGFDDVASAGAARPPLTTVRQPGSELGREALKQLVLLASGATQPGERVLPVELKLRRSCGCSALERAPLERASSPTNPTSLELALIQRRQLIVAELARAAQGGFGSAGPDWESSLLGALVEEVREGTPGALSRRCQRLLQKLEQAGSDLTAAPHVLATLRRQALSCSSGQGKERDILEDAISDAQLVASGMLVQAAISGARAASGRFRELGRLVHERMFEGAAAVSRVLAERLPALGVDACVAAALNDGAGDEQSGSICLGFAPGQGPPLRQQLPLWRLPEHPYVQQARTLFLLPVALGTEPLGVAVISVTLQLAHGELIEDLRELLGPVLKVVKAKA